MEADQLCGTKTTREEGDGQANAKKRKSPSPAGGRAPTWQANQPVCANYRGLGVWYPGKIMAVNQDGTYDISYDDGDEERHTVDEHLKMVRNCLLRTTARNGAV